MVSAKVLKGMWKLKMLTYLDIRFPVSIVTFRIRYYATGNRKNS